MEDYASSFLDVIDESTDLAADDRDDESHHEAEAAAGAEPGKKRRSLRNGIFRAANLQDKLLEKLVSQVIPADDSQAQPRDVSNDDLPGGFAERPGFSLPLMTTNFRRFNARIGVVFRFQARALRLFAWRRPTHTLSFLAVYTFVCLDPYLLFALPLALSLFGILVPSFLARHPAPASDADRVRNMSYSPRGPPLAPARTVKPTKELSRDFFRNMGDLQNVMEDFSVAHDKVLALVVPKTNFSDEALSSGVFVLLFAGSLVMLIAGHLLPLRLIALVGGWAGIWSGNPTVARWLRQAQQHYLSPPPTDNKPAPQQQQQQPPLPIPIPKTATPPNPIQTLQTLLTHDILLDTAPETREVEIFELQHQSSPLSREWEPWLFSPSPHDPLSAARLAHDRPSGARFFEDVLPPEGWEWSEKKWALDLWSREWVEERIITGVEVETEGERWVYDMWAGPAAAPNDSGNAGDDGDETGGWFGGGGGGRETSEVGPGEVGAGGVGDGGPQLPVPAPGVSWEEREAGLGRRGQWRRRRWVRMVKRRKVVS
ncbi:peroxisomal membrane protein PEX29 [Dichotomopilus funicola]|uniref:Peroxisomal membrane protein PEX29 n=1 Tax=Dichotomopilus funicola TaxID=1934379 RepID=A0AAN6V4J1_9PEZI|nr:peroxisomal membrane protein PEX29 [Dichotomopilus funicola]